MRKIALLISFFALSGTLAATVAAFDRAAMPLMEVPAISDNKDKDKRAKKDQKEGGVTSSAGSETLPKSCCAKPSRAAALTAKPAAPVKKQ